MLVADVDAGLDRADTRSWHVSFAYDGVMGVLRSIKAFFYRQQHPGKCYVCKQPLRDDDASGLCASQDCRYEDFSRSQW